MAVAIKDPADPPRHIGFGPVLRSRTVRLLAGAETQSTIGDQVARVALSVLVFHRTGSAAETAVVYAATFAPAIIGGAVLSSIADRRPRIQVMIACDLIRALLFAAMLLPALGTASLIALVVVAVLFEPVFTSAQAAYLAAVLSPPVFASASGVRVALTQIAQVLGFGVGGILVAAAGARIGLLINAVTFVVSALLVFVGADRTQGVATAGPRPQPRGEHAGRWFWRDRQRRALLATICLAGLFVVPEGLAVPYAAQQHAGRFGFAVLLVALPVGTALGAALLVRWIPNDRRPRVSGALAICCGLPLIATAVVPWWAAAGCWMACGALVAYQVPMFTAIVQAAPDSQRSGIVGFGGAALIAAQGAGLLIAGGVAAAWSSGTAVALAGGLGSAAALMLMRGPLRMWTAP